MTVGLHDAGAIGDVVFALGDKAYVQMKYLNNAKMLGKRSGEVTYMIYDLGDSSAVTLNPAKKTYHKTKLTKGQASSLTGLISKLSKVDDAKKFVGKTDQHGIFYNFKTINTTVIKAEKNVKIDAAKLAVPTGYREVPAPKKGRR